MTRTADLEPLAAAIRRVTLHRHISLACASMCFVWLTFAPAVSSGQAATLSELSSELKTGDPVEVTGDRGRTRGAFESLSPDWLTVRVSGREIRYAANRVQRVRRIDSLTNGTLIGLGTGMTAGFIVALGMKPNLQRCLAGPAGLVNQLEGCGDNRNSAFGTLTLVGYVAGYAIDSFMKKTLYVSPQSGASVSIAPVLRPGHQGRAVGVRLTLSTSHPAVSP